MRIAVLVSGHGSNLQALLDAQLSGEIVGVLSNKTTAYALQRATAVGIATCVIEHYHYATREAFDDAMHQQLCKWQVDLVILAGFMRILSAEFVTQWEGKMLNIHPSLLPKYKGMHTHARALEAGDHQHGCTVHFVSPQLDSGQAIAQGVVDIHKEDNLDTLASKVHELEHQVYPMVIEWICQNKLIYKQSDYVVLDRKRLSEPVRIYAKSGNKKVHHH